MISAFISREFGLGLELSTEQLQKINLYRAGKKYVDEEAAKFVHKGNVMKQDLKDSPFVVYFELGADNHGYWTYNHMAVQFEDCVDCCKALYPDYDFAFFFDHSQGHARKKAGGLDAGSMNAGYGGCQPPMDPSVIQKEEGYLGPYERVLSVGDTQHFVFQPGDVGPFWLTPEEREQTRHPYQQGTRDHTKTIAELKQELSSRGATIDPRRNYRLAELQSLAQNHGIETVEKDKPVIKTGWEGKPKGMKQVLWERGFIDEAYHDEYHVLPKKGPDGDIDEDSENTSLLFLMSTCLDFATEVTALQNVGEQLGVKVFITPKFHAEIAGEGIEYAWGVSKGVYRRKPLAAKKGKKKDFQNLVKACFNRTVLPTETVRKLSRRARAYICAYYAIEAKNALGGNDDIVSLPAIEALMKQFKTHRSALDFDRSFCESVVRRIGRE